MKNISIVIDIKRTHRRHFELKMRQRLLSRICKDLARGFPALGVYHSHQSEKKGGEFSPHIHLIVRVPNTRSERFIIGLEADLLSRDKKGYFRLSTPEKWVIQENCEDLGRYHMERYILGSGRTHLPSIVYGNKFFELSQEELKAVAPPTSDPHSLS